MYRNLIMAARPFRRWLIVALLASFVGTFVSFHARGDEVAGDEATLSETTRQDLERECAGKLDELRAQVEASRRDLAKEKDDELNSEKAKLGQVSTSLASCEEAARKLAEDVKILQSQLEKERSMRSGSVGQLGAALSQLEELREAWLPFWFAEKVEAARVAAAPKVRQMASAIEKHSSDAAHFWRHTASPKVEQMSRQGWTQVQGLGSLAASKANDAYRRVPFKYRKHMDAMISGVRRAWPPTRRALVVGRAHVVQAVDEIALLVERSPMAPAFAKEASHIVAMLVVSLPLTLMIPAMARRRSPEVAVPKALKPSKKKKN